jgi:hypothetical protein
MSAGRDRLEELLLAEPYLEDEGFTDRVMARIPPPRRDLRPLALGISGVAAAALAAICLPELVRDAADAAAAWQLPAGSGPGMALAGLAALGAAAVAGALLARGE